MKNGHVRRITSLIPGVLAGVCGVVFGHPYMGVYAETTQSKLDEAQSDYSSTKDKKDSAESELDKLTSDKDSLAGVLDELNVKMSEAGDILEGLEDNISNTQNEIDLTWGRIEELSVTIEELEVRADEEYEKAKEQIKFAYETGGSLRPVYMSGEMSYADYINRTFYMQMFAAYYQNTINELEQTCTELADTKEEHEENLMKLEVSKEALEEYQATVQDQYAEINEEFEAVQAKVAAYEDEIEDTRKLISKYEQDLVDKQNDIDSLKAQIEAEKKISEQAATQEWRDISTVTTADSDRKLLANLIWCEAGNEPYTGQVAVGAVVMNRVMSPSFPDSITGVIYQGKQFTPAKSGRLALALSLDSATESCYQAADAALAGVNNVGNCLYFRSSSSGVSAKYTIGSHVFY